MLIFSTLLTEIILRNCVISTAYNASLALLYKIILI